MVSGFIIMKLTVVLYVLCCNDTENRLALFSERK